MQQLRATVLPASIVPCIVCGVFLLIHISGFIHEPRSLYTMWRKHALDSSPYGWIYPRFWHATLL